MEGYLNLNEWKNREKKQRHWAQRSWVDEDRREGERKTVKGRNASKISSLG